MRIRVLPIWGFALLSIGLIGCQSAPRFAWWKKDAAPDDSSVVARTAPDLPSKPELPSKQVSPQTLTASRAAGAKPPGYTATAALPPSAQAVPSSSAATIFGAPTAEYADTQSQAPPVAAMPPTTPQGITAPPTAAPPVLAQASPYDPNAYPGAKEADRGQVMGLNKETIAPAEPDRYGMTASASAPPASPIAPAAEPPAPAGDRYSLGSMSAGAAAPDPAATPSSSGFASAAPDDRYAMPPAAPMASAAMPPAAPATAALPNTNSLGATQYAIAPTQSMSAAPAAPPIAAAPAAAPAAMATVQLAAPPGQYRPGGTSSYQALGSATQTEIASRVPGPPAAAPNVPTATYPGAPAQPAYPSAQPAVGTPGVRAY